MQIPFSAFYENGVFKPLHPVDLQEHEVVSLAIVSVDDPNQTEPIDLLGLQCEAFDAMLSETSSLPLEGPQDEFSNRDHDLILYGCRK